MYIMLNRILTSSLVNHGKTQIASNPLSTKSLIANPELPRQYQDKCSTIVNVLKSKRNRGRPGFDVGCKAAWRIPRTRNLANQLEKK